MLLDQVPLIAAAALEVEAATIFLLESNRLEFRVAAGVGPMASQEAGELVPNRPDTPAGFVLSQGRPVIIDNLNAEARFNIPQAYLDAGIASGLSVPLSDRGRMIGVVAVRSREPKRFGDDEVRFVESLANLLATSLQRAQTEEALNHAQRLESVGQLTGGIAHDFNNLLTVIQGNLQVLQESSELDGQAHSLQLVAAATRASKRGAELTGKLLAFSRRQVLQPSAVDVDALLHSLSDMLRRTLDQHIRIELEVQPCPPCLADAGQLESALLNIAINARDAMPDGGTLRFRVQHCATLPDHIHGELDKAEAINAGFVAISISDSGTGMAEEVKERVFEPFFTTKEAGRGTGLGLSTVYGFVKQSKGGVAIDSRVGHGTTVTLFIPQLAATAPRNETGHADEHIAPGLRVLLVEDDVDVRPVVQNFLGTLRCDVTVCTNGEQALAVLESGAAFDLLLTDIALGAGMRGTALAALAQERNPALRVLLMSGFSAELLEADRDSPPSWELLRKPYSRAELAGAISRVMNA